MNKFSQNSLLKELLRSDPRCLILISLISIGISATNSYALPQNLKDLKANKNAIAARLEDANIKEQIRSVIKDAIQETQIEQHVAVIKDVSKTAVIDKIQSAHIDSGKLNVNKFENKIQSSLVNVDRLVNHANKNLNKENLNKLIEKGRLSNLRNKIGDLKDVTDDPDEIIVIVDETEDTLTLALDDDGWIAVTIDPDKISQENINFAESVEKSRILTIDAGDIARNVINLKKTEVAYKVKVTDGVIRIASKKEIEEDIRIAKNAAVTEDDASVTEEPASNDEPTAEQPATEQPPEEQITELAFLEDDLNANGFDGGGLIENPSPQTPPSFEVEDGSGSQQNMGWTSGGDENYTQGRGEMGGAQSDEDPPPSDPLIPYSGSEEGDDSAFNGSDVPGTSNPDPETNIGRDPPSQIAFEYNETFNSQNQLETNYFESILLEAKSQNSSKPSYSFINASKQKIRELISSVSSPRTYLAKENYLQQLKSTFSVKIKIDQHQSPPQNLPDQVPKLS